VIALRGFAPTAPGDSDRGDDAPDQAPSAAPSAAPAADDGGAP